MTAPDQPEPICGPSCTPDCGMGHCYLTDGTYIDPEDEHKLNNQANEHAANELPATPKLAADDLRDRVAEALRQAFHHWITAEWICCEPLAKGHKLCKKGHATRRMVRALLADDPEEWPPKSPIIDAVMAVVQPSQLPASPTAGSNDLRQQLADAVQGQVQTILRKRGDRHPTLAAVIDVCAAVVQPVLDAKDAEIARLRTERRDWQMAAQTAENELAQLRHQQIGDL